MTQSPRAALLVVLITSFLLTTGVVADTSLSPWVWVLRSTGTDASGAYATLTYGEKGKPTMVRVGHELEGARVVRIERARVMLRAPTQLHTLTMNEQEEGVLATPLLASVLDQADPGQDLNGLLSEKLQQEIARPPRSMSHADRLRLVRELRAVVDERKVRTAWTTMIIGGGEELVEGVRLATPISGINLQPEDLLLMFNSVAPGTNRNRWEELFNMINGATLLVVASVHDLQLQISIYQVAD